MNRYETKILCSFGYEDFQVFPFLFFFNLQSFFCFRDGIVSPTLLGNDIKENDELGNDINENDELGNDINESDETEGIRQDLRRSNRIRKQRINISPDEIGECDDEKDEDYN